MSESPSNDGPGPVVINVVACRKRWDELRRVRGASDVRWCSDCEQRVFAVEDQDGLIAAVAANRCVHTTMEGVVVMGEPYIEEYMAPPPLKWDDDPKP